MPSQSGKSLTTPTNPNLPRRDPKLARLAIGIEMNEIRFAYARTDPAHAAWGTLVCLGPSSTAPEGRPHHRTRREIGGTIPHLTISFRNYEGSHSREARPWDRDYIRRPRTAMVSFRRSAAIISPIPVVTRCQRHDEVFYSSRSTPSRPDIGCSLQPEPAHPSSGSR